MRTDINEDYMRKVGDRFIIYPLDDLWAPARQVIGTFPEAFMADRNQPPGEEPECFCLTQAFAFTS